MIQRFIYSLLKGGELLFSSWWFCCEWKDFKRALGSWYSCFDRLSICCTRPGLDQINAIDQDWLVVQAAGITHVCWSFFGLLEAMTTRVVWPVDDGMKFSWATWVVGPSLSLGWGSCALLWVSWEVGYPFGLGLIGGYATYINWGYFSLQMRICFV